MIINSKYKMYKALKSGILGNTNKFYNKLSEIPDNEILSMRWNQPGNMKKCNHAITKKEIEKSKVDLNNITICKQPQNDANSFFNAELMRNELGLYLVYKIGLMWMKPAMKNPDIATGLKAKIILKEYLLPSDYDDLISLLDLYENHIIEFSIFDGCVGIIPYRTMIIWEVRAY